MGNTKSYKDDKEYQRYLRTKKLKSKLTAWGIFGGIGLLVVGGVYGILRLNHIGFSKETSGFSDETSSVDDLNSKLDEHMILEITDYDSENDTVQFNTAYGGTDYGEELDEFKQSSGNTDVDAITEYLENDVKLASKFDNINSWVGTDFVSGNFYSSDTVVVNSYYPLTWEVLRGNNICDITLTCIGVLQDYFGVFWLEGTNFYFISDERSTLYSADFFYNQMLHIGKNKSFTFLTSDLTVEFVPNQDVVMIYIPTYDYSKASTGGVDNTGSDNDEVAFDRFNFCEVNIDDYEVLMSVSSKFEDFFNFRRSSISFSELTSDKSRSFSARQDFDIKSVFNSEWNNRADTQSASEVGVYTFKGLGYVGKTNNYVCLKYSDDIFFILDISMAHRDLCNYSMENSFVSPFSIMSNNIRAYEDGDKTFIVGYFVTE